MSIFRSTRGRLVLIAVAIFAVALVVSVAMDVTLLSVSHHPGTPARVVPPQ